MRLRSSVGTFGGVRCHFNCLPRLFGYGGEERIEKLRMETQVQILEDVWPGGVTFLWFSGAGGQVRRVRPNRGG